MKAMFAKSFNNFRRLIGALGVAALALTVFLAQPAAATQDSTLSSSEQKTALEEISTDDLHQLIDISKEADPAGHEARAELVRSSHVNVEMPTGFSTGDADLDAEVLATVFDDYEALAGILDMYDAGAINVETDASGITVWEFDEDAFGVSGSGGIGPQSETMPQCPSAWAAAIAWISANVGMCAALTPVPPAAIACAAGFGIGGFIIDVNQGC
ncbi:hypothetical protein [Auritidibacter ignavus]|uniref:hypothetical protein n=1 Tax=Auritidibacter ignavus TaxID=678932 RepID=UPI0024BA2636|nr:hypothetical protein [Auritidibacter ignavus]WHS28685.1 hypothetical protein QM395_02815 [Auritidibacter ignavus]